MITAQNRLSTFDQMPATALVSVNDLVALSGRSRTSLWRDVNQGRLSKPVRLGPNCVRWRVEDARKYLAGGY
jgi:predicted DNA-binding transcriptional regulator AlpA